MRTMRPLSDAEKAMREHIRRNKNCGCASVCAALMDEHRDCRAALAKARQALADDEQTATEYVRMANERDAANARAEEAERAVLALELALTQLVDSLSYGDDTPGWKSPCCGASEHTHSVSCGVGNVLRSVTPLVARIRERRR